MGACLNDIKKVRRVRNGIDIVELERTAAASQVDFRVAVKKCSGGLSRIWFELGATQQYYPLLHTAFWIEHKLWGDSLWGYHVINVLWHSIAVLLVYFVLQRLKVPGALLAVAIFALHPVMVESVAWISEQKNTLSAVFYLAAMRSYLEFDDSRRRTHYGLAFVLFVLGLLTKTVVATLPAALLVIFWWRRGTLFFQRDLLPLVPFFAFGAVAGLTTAWIERSLIGADGAQFEMSLLQRFLLAGRVVWFYLSTLAWPANLTFIYPRWTIEPDRWWQWTFPIAALATTAVLWAVRKRWRAPLAGWLFFCGTLFPVMGFLNVYPFIYSFVADHFQYLASLGPIVLAAAGITLALARLSEPVRKIGLAFPVLLVGTLACLSWRQSHMYADSVALYQTTLDRNPNCWMAHHNLGLSLVNRGNEPDAIEQYRAALRLNPTLVDAHSNLGLLLTHAGRLPEAIDELHQALALKPDYPDALNNLGIALVSAGRHPEAVEQFERALQVRPDYAMAHNNLGTALYRIGKMPAAIEQYRQAVQLDPNYADAHKNLGIADADAGNLEGAIAQFEHAVRLQPDFAAAHFHLGDALRKIGRLEPAIEHYRAALRTSPDFIQAYANLVLALNLANRSTEAVATAEQAIAVARTTGQEEAAQQLEEWLKHYRAELRRTNEAAPTSQSPPKAQ